MNLEENEKNEKELEKRIQQMEIFLNELTLEEKELRESVSELKFREDKVFVMMALNGEKLNNKIEERLKDLIAGHSNNKEKVNSLISENKILKKKMIEDKENCFNKSLGSLTDVQKFDSLIQIKNNSII